MLDNCITFVNEAFNKTDWFNRGFLKGTQIKDNFLILNTCIQKQLCLGGKLYVAFLDFKKAINYDKYNVLFYKFL